MQCILAVLPKGYMIILMISSGIHHHYYYYLVLVLSFLSVIQVLSTHKLSPEVVHTSGPATPSVGDQAHRGNDA